MVMTVMKAGDGRVMMVVMTVMVMVLRGDVCSEEFLRFWMVVVMMDGEVVMIVGECCGSCDV